MTAEVDKQVSMVGAKDRASTALAAIVDLDRLGSKVVGVEAVAAVT